MKSPNFSTHCGEEYWGGPSNTGRGGEGTGGGGVQFALLWLEEVATNISLFFCKGQVTVAVKAFLFC